MGSFHFGRAVLDRWRRLHVELPDGVTPPALPGVIDIDSTGHIGIVTANGFSPDIPAAFESAGIVVREIQRMTLEEIFVATVMASRKEQDE